MHVRHSIRIHRGVAGEAWKSKLEFKHIEKWKYVVGMSVGMSLYSVELVALRYFPGI